MLLYRDFPQKFVNNGMKKSTCSYMFDVHVNKDVFKHLWKICIVEKPHSNLNSFMLLKFWNVNPIDIIQYFLTTDRINGSPFDTVLNSSWLLLS